MKANNNRFSCQSPSAFAAASLIFMAAVILGAIFVVFHARPDPETSMVRVVNDTGAPLKNIRVNDVSFGDLPVGGTSRYRPLTPAYRYASLRLETAGETFEWMPADYFGEKPLGNGNFTYSIRRADTALGPEFDVYIRDNVTD